MQYHNYSLSELENMMPWERKMYVTLVQRHVEEENMRIQQQNEKIAAANKSRR